MRWSERTIIGTLLALVVIIQLFFGLPRLTQFSAVDEHLWTYERIPQFWNALTEGRFKKTNINDKPGISVALISGFGMLQVDPKPYESLRVEAKTAQDIALIETIHRAFRLPVYVFTLCMLPVFYFLLLQPKPLLMAILACFFFFLVAMPTYVETQAVGTALGTPTKTTRTGLSFYQITFSSGEARVALGLAGLLLITFLRTRTRYASAFLLGWGGVLLVMTMFPHLLFIDIPSNRIGAYLSFPLGILASFALIGSIAFFHQHKKQFFVPSLFIFFFLFSSFLFASGSGSYDNSQALLLESKSLPVLQTFAASRYLAEQVTPTDIVLKDHNYIVGDAWMKLFFLRDYGYPLSRGFFKRYQDNPNREQCTLLMISVPNTERAQKCYTETNTQYVVVNPKFDVTPFEKSSHFSRVYTSPDIHIYSRIK